jgi:catechol 2,3-dioxygenase-like lactoylglutathione lyase family enzyme
MSHPLYDHVGLKVGDLDAAVRFYATASQPLGDQPGSRDERTS